MTSIKLNQSSPLNILSRHPDFTTPYKHLLDIIAERTLLENLQILHITHSSSCRQRAAYLPAAAWHSIMREYTLHGHGTWISWDYASHILVRFATDLFHPELAVWSSLGLGFGNVGLGIRGMLCFLEGFVPLLRIVPRQQDWGGGRYLRWRFSLN